MSRRLGTLVMVTGSDSSMQAKRMGRAAFFEPLTSIAPVSGTPPSITSLSMCVPEIFFCCNMLSAPAIVNGADGLQI